MRSSIPRHLKIIAAIVANVFCLQQLAFAAPDLKLNELSLFQKPLYRFQLPQSVALIEEEYRAPAHRGPGTRLPAKTIILIQDAHTNDSAQINTAKALDTILQTEKIRHIFLEAGTGNHDDEGLEEGLKQ